VRCAHRPTLDNIFVSGAFVFSFYSVLVRTVILVSVLVLARERPTIFLIFVFVHQNNTTVSMFFSVRPIMLLAVSQPAVTLLHVAIMRQAIVVGRGDNYKRQQMDERPTLH